MTYTADDVVRAVETDHPCHDDNTCDIAHALEAGFPFVAAHLLYGATECPALDAIGYRDSRDPEGWDDWVTYFKANTRQCPGCEAFVFVEDDYRDAEQTCSNCLAILPAIESAE